MAVALGIAAISQSSPPDTVGAPAADAHVSPLVNWHDALAAVNGDRETLLSVMDAFLMEARALVRQLREAQQNGDAVSMQRAGHTLKGSLRFFGAVDVADVAWQVESAAREGLLPLDAPQIDKLIDGVLSVSAAIKNGIPED